MKLLVSVFLFINILSFSLETSLENEDIFRKLGQSQMGNEILQSIQIELSQNDDYDKQAIPHVIDLLNQIKENINVQSQEAYLKYTESQKNCTQDLPNYRATLNKINSQIKDGQLKLPSLQQKVNIQTQKTLNLQNSIQASTEEIQDIKNKLPEEQNKHNEMLEDYDECISFLESEIKWIKSNLESGHPNTESYIQLHQNHRKQFKHLQLANIIKQFTQLSNNKEIYSNQSLVNKLLDNFQGILEYFYEQRQEEIRIFNNYKKVLNEEIQQSEDLQSQAQQNLSTAKNILENNKQALQLVNESLGDLQERKTNTNLLVQSIESNCNSVNSELQTNHENFEGIYNLIGQVINILEHSSISQVNATVGKVLSGEFYNEQRGIAL